MSILVGISAVLASILAVLFVFVFRKLTAVENLPMEADWVEQVSADRYRPMQKLLDDREYAGLRAHPACNRKMLRRFRVSRIQAFRGYLTYLSTDYGRMCTAIKLLMVQSAQDRPDLAALLVRQRVTFTLRLMLAQLHLQLHALGFGQVDAGRLVGSLDAVRLELRGLMLATAQAAA